ncbi:MAG: hypothetical protein H0U07_01310, partial [Actinobacteria bacterium]|nr:hypothetical protein [Actinomycetota bacterium]
EAYTVTQILEENVDYGTGTAASYGHPAAGKTGTTDNHADAWFCGYTPRLQTTVWVGHPKGEIPMQNVHGIAVTGGTYPAEIWRLFMGAAIGHLTPVEFDVPAELPEWKPFEQRQHSRSYDSGYYDSDDDDSGGSYTPPAATEDTEEETAAPPPPAAPTPAPTPTQQPKPKPAPPTPAPTPAPTPTEPPPPPPTTAAPPSPPPTDPAPPPPTEPVSP